MANSTFANTVIRLPTSEHTATIILCHGLGQSTSQYDLDIQFLSQRLPSVKWILPQAPSQPVSYSEGLTHPSWFNIWQLPPHTEEFDELGIVESISFIEQLILAEVHDGLDPKKILLIGFSQGAALCLMTALTTLHDLGGVGSLSGWIPHRIREHIIQTDPSLPVFWSHGKDDTEIPTWYARNSVEFLEQRLCMNDETLHYVEYADLGHEVSERVLSDLVQWMAIVLFS